LRTSLVGCHENQVWPGGFEPAADFSGSHFDITPTLRALENHVRKTERINLEETECSACLG
jgi:hypothetical protein